MLSYQLLDLIALKKMSVKWSPHWVRQADLNTEQYYELVLDEKDLNPATEKKLKAYLGAIL